MKIGKVKLTIDKDYVTLSAKCQIRRFGTDILYFKFDKRFKDFIFKDASPFAAALLIPAMKLGEDLVIEDQISKKLYLGMQEGIKVMQSFGLGLKPINIKAKKLKSDNQKSKYIASFFSGGVDSFYTYLKNKKRKDGKISYFILVNGGDISLANHELWQFTLNNVKKIAKEAKIEVITVESNLRDLIDPIMEWDYSFVGGLAGVALALRNKLTKVYRGSSYSNQLTSGPTDMVVDPYLGSEKLALIHDVDSSSRVEKVEEIAKYKLVLNNLRVCYLNKKNTYNCGTCDKCLRTMINLKIAGKLSKSKTFPHKINLNLVRKLSNSSEHAAIFQRENLLKLEKHNLDPKLQRAIKYSLKKISKKPSLIDDVIYQIMFLDHLYTKGMARKLLHSVKGEYF